MQGQRTALMGVPKQGDGAGSLPQWRAPPADQKSVLLPDVLGKHFSWKFTIRLIQ